MIPKIIHYCWFGRSPLPELAQRCIESWKKYCPDYDIIEWNEDNFDVNINVYTRQAYEEKKWAFVSDVSRLFALVTCGGIYMDTDVELLKPIDRFLSLEAFSGFEAKDNIQTGIMGSQKNYKLFSEILEQYNETTFIRPDGTYNLTTNVTTITKYCSAHGLVKNNMLQTIDGFTLYPSEYFCPKDHEIGLLHLTENTYAIHHFDGSWLTPQQQYNQKLVRGIYKYIPLKASAYLAAFLSIWKFQGFYVILKKAIKKFFY